MSRIPLFVDDDSTLVVSAGLDNLCGSCPVPFLSMLRRSLAVPALVVLGALAVLPAASATDQRGGLYGTATLMPVRPICIEGRPCGKPAVGLVLRFSRDGRVVGRVTTSRAGFYRVSLVRGIYVVSIDSGSHRREITPRTVRVVAGSQRRADFEIDTGLQ